MGKSVNLLIIGCVTLCAFVILDMTYTAIILCYDTVDSVQARPGFRYSILPRVTSEFEASTDQVRNIAWANIFFL